MITDYRRGEFWDSFRRWLRQEAPESLTILKDHEQRQLFNYFLDNLLEEVFKSGLEQGEEKGYEAGSNKGYDEGYDDGLKELKIKEKLKNVTKPNSI